MNRTKIFLFTLSFVLASLPLQGQNIYTNPAIGEVDHGGADLISLSAGHTATAWLFELEFTHETLDTENLAFHLILDTDLTGTPSLWLGYPTTPDFGDDLLLLYNSRERLTPRLGLRDSNGSTSYSYPDNLLTFETNRIIVDIPRHLAPATSGQAEFLLQLGVPLSENSFSVTHNFPDLLAPELRTATVPEPETACLMVALFAGLCAVSRRKGAFQTSSESPAV